jgi:hypothetical protein
VERGCDVANVVWSHSRTPVPWVTHGIGVAVFENTLVIAAWADGANAKNANAATIAAANRSLTSSLPVELGAMLPPLWSGNGRRRRRTSMSGVKPP